MGLRGDCASHNRTDEIRHNLYEGIAAARAPPPRSEAGRATRPESPY